MKKKYFIVFSFFILCLCFNNERQLTIHASKNNMEAPKQTYLNELESVDDYYTTFANEDVTGLSHDALLEKLAKIMSKTHRYYTSYDDIKGANAFSDESLTNPSKVVAFYGGINISNTWQPTNYSDVEAWNREHVWCKSLSGGLYTSVSASTRNAGTDIHQLKPSVQKLNSTRNNLMYGDLNHQGTELLYEHTSGIIHTGNYYTSYAFEPRDEIKGDVSRILMYMYTHYSTQVSNSTSGKNGDLRIENIIYTTNNSSTDAWNLLLHWNEMDKVDEFESKRNEYCASITGVRNPFIDHPEFASMIWNESYDGQGALLDDASTNYLNLISSEVTLHIDETYQITPITNIENASFNYSVENDSIVSVDENGLVKALCEGTSKVNITCDDLTTSLLVNVISENESAYWELVTSNEDLVIGNSYFIAAKEYDVALSNNQKSNNRGQIEISKNENFASINKDVAIITLESGISESSYALKVKDGYLYAAGENFEDRNYLRTKETLDETGSFNIEILENCSANIVSIDENTLKNTIRYNKVSSLFSCYAKGQKDICMYKYVGPNELDVSISISLSFLATYISYDLINYQLDSVSNHQVNLEGQVRNDNNTYGILLCLQEKLDGKSFLEIYKEYYDLNNMTSELNITNHILSINDDKLIYSFKDFTSKYSNYSFAFYKIDIDNQQVLFSSTKNFSLQLMIDLYLSNDYLLDDFTNKEEILSALKDS